MPYIPYIFTKTAGQEDGSPRLIVKSRYAIVANLLGAGQFYRLITFKNVDSVIAGISFTSGETPFESNGSVGDTSDGALTYDTVGNSFDQVPGGFSYEDGNW